jgi:hypothetical protein
MRPAFALAATPPFQAPKTQREAVGPSAFASPRPVTGPTPPPGLFTVRGTQERLEVTNRWVG